MQDLNTVPMVDVISELTGRTVVMKDTDYVFFDTKEVVEEEVLNEAVILKKQKEDKELEKKYTKELEDFMDSKANEKGYDNRYTAAARAGVVGSPFQEEGQAFAVWMDNCYAMGYKILADVQSGTIPLPTVEEFLLELPILEW